MLAFSLIFKDPISHAIFERDCTDFQFYHVKLKICDQKSEQEFLTETSQITKLVTDMEKKYGELAEVNSEMLSVLEECNKTPESSAIKKKATSVNQKFKVLKPDIDIYSSALNARLITAGIQN